MLGALYKFHVGFAISVIDEVLERITVGLETNDFKYNQRRIAEVKYLGELYIYRLVDSGLIFDTLYQILNYGHDGYAQPGKISQMDLPDDYFRIRLVAALLETCGVYFERGANKRKLDFYLAFLQYYINLKDPLPMDVEFVVQDLYSLLRKDWKLVLNDLPEASRVFAEACKQNYQDTASGKAAEVEDEEPTAEPDGSHDPRADDEDARLADDDAEDAKSDDEEAAQAEDGAGTPAESDDEEHIVVTRPEDQRDPEAEAEFDRELAKMMAESVESRRTERKPMFDVPLPMRRTVRDATSTAADDSGGESPAPAAPGQGTMKFALLSKKGNRQQTRSIDLPSDSNFAIAMRNQQEAERAEQQRIKNLVLNYDLTDDQNDGIPQPNFHYVHSRNGTRTRLVGNGSLNKSLAPPPFFRAGGRSQRSTSSGTKDDDGSAKKPVHPGTFESLHGQPRIDKSGNTRSKQRSRKLQLSDVDW
ncbi:hypothetical protein KC315_g18352 [Hortaea werneckii]|nr:hypothetical protein KC315_g18352 [Hortaea werneckii]